MGKINTQTKNLHIEYVPIDTLRAAEYNPRKWDEEAQRQLRESLSQFGVVDPLLVNGAENRRHIVIGGHFRLSVMKELGFKEAPVVYLHIPDVEREKSLNIRLNKAVGEWDWNLLAEFDEAFLSNVGFSSEEMDEIFPVEETPERFDLEKELKKLQIENIEIQKGDIWKIGSHKFMCGDSTVRKDVLALMDGAKADMCFTDPPYILDYLRGKKKKDTTPPSYQETAHGGRLLSIIPQRGQLGLVEFPAVPYKGSRDVFILLSRRTSDACK